MSATFPDEICEEMGIEQMTVVPFSKGIEGGYIVDYTLWLPSLTKHADGTTSVEADIPVGFEQYERSMVLKALYHAVCMLRTGSRRTIVYLGTQAECDTYMKVAQRVFEDYHGLTVWMGKITSEVGRGEREALLRDFQAEGDSFRILTSVRILDEAIDVPACDSVFITTVGEHTSDIRFFQRAQRSGTLDPKNPNKRNHIFLWAEGWEKCVEALTLLRTSDPEFHRKVRHIGVEYDKKETVQEAKGRRVKEREEFTEWSRMACETVEERVRRKAEMLLAFVEKEGRIPKTSEEWGNFWNSIRQHKSNHAIYLAVLSKNQILRRDYERVQRNKENKKGKYVATPKEKADKLLQFVEKEGRIPKISEEGGTFWFHIIKQDNHKDIYQNQLAHNPILQRHYEEYKRMKLIDNNNMSSEEKGRLLIEFVERENRTPKTTDIVDGFHVGKWWIIVVKRGDSKKVYNTLLSKNILLKTEYDRVQQVKEAKKTRKFTTPKEKAQLLLTFVEREERIPKKSEEVEGVLLRRFWTSVTQGASSTLYQTLLSQNPLLRQHYERIQLRKQQKQQKDSD